ncbi:hypothetical protein [Caballeronia sp. INML2]|jgi:hypothetical protein|nr:hypothetical protein [Caballeronia sp. INML2]
MKRKHERQAYAQRRVTVAVGRLIVATTPSEKAQAGRWARLWGKVAATRY